MRKPAFCICEKKGADQLRGSHAADQHLCFRYIDSKSLSFLNPKCHCTVALVSDLVGNTEDRFSSPRLKFLAKLNIDCIINILCFVYLPGESLAGPIVGGVVGGLALVAIVIVMLVMFR